MPKKQLHNPRIIWCKNFQEVLHGVGADGVGVKFPIFAVNCCCLSLSFIRRRREKRRKTKKSENKKKKTKKKVKMHKKGESHSDPIYTNPIKNLPEFTSGHARPRHATRICNFGDFSSLCLTFFFSGENCPISERRKPRKIVSRLELRKTWPPTG